MLVKLRFTFSAMEFFKLHKREYIGHGITPLLECALGKEALSKHVCAQDPPMWWKNTGCYLFQ